MNAGFEYWVGSLGYITSDEVNNFRISSNGIVYRNKTVYTYGDRPCISLVPGFSLSSSSEDGTENSFYVVE